MVIDFLKFTSRLSTRQWSLISLCLHQDPLRGNGYWFPYVHIKTLYEAMVIDFLMFTSRLSMRQWSLISFVTSIPSARQWSLISLYLYQDPLQGNDHWFLYVYIKTLYEAMVIDYLMLTSWSSMRQWSLISSCSHQDPLQSNGHGFSLHWGPLRDNGHQFLYIKALCKTMVIDFFVRSGPSTW